ncbi:MAG: HU family DNA-binding protein [Clostridia bacterium]|jgi:DNA-binding protein HU-beta|nr:HU family DNA-binding protein [Clostridia bacterium]MBR3934258.1 HU family DNA-binding protein [Clostridia bacterium]
MNKSELIAKIADKAELTKKDAEKALNAFVESVTEALKADDKVVLVGFGSFETKKRAARKGKNPQTGAIIDIPAATVPAFKVGKALKDAVK